MSSGPEFHVETAKVVEVWRGRAIVELEKPAGAGERPECARCGLCVATGRGADAPVELRAEIAPGVTAAPGDRVEVRLRLTSPGKAAVLLLGLPLVAFLGAAFLANWLWRSEAVTVACGFGALFLAFLALMAYDRARGAQAVVTRKL